MTTIPSRGWGEDFWVKVSERCGDCFRGVVDNSLAEARLYGLNQGDMIIFQEDHILAVHDIHRQELVAEMDEADLKELTQWLAEIRGTQR
jgi:hypothetical protein